MSQEGFFSRTLQALGLGREGFLRSKWFEQSCHLGRMGGREELVPRFLGGVRRRWGQMPLAGGPGMH